MKSRTRSRVLTLSLLTVGLLAHAATLVNINTASVTELDALKGIGPAKAQAIVDYRTLHGPFAAIEDIQKVKGIGPATYAGIKESISVDAPSTPVVSTTTQPQPVVASTRSAVTAHKAAPVAAAVVAPMVASRATPAPAAQKASPNDSLAVVGLATLVIVGAGVVWRMGKPPVETKSPADEFEIE